MKEFLVSYTRHSTASFHRQDLLKQTSSFDSKINVVHTTFYRELPQKEMTSDSVAMLGQQLQQKPTRRRGVDLTSVNQALTRGIKKNLAFK